MTSKKKLLDELDSKFKEIQSQLGFSSSFEEIDSAFFIKDGILEAGYVSDNFEKQLSLRIVSNFYSWTGEMHAWLIPPQGNVICHTEYKALEDNDKKIIKKLIKKAMYFLRKNQINGLNNDKAEIGRLIDEMVTYKKEFKKELLKILEKQRDTWISELMDER